MEMGTRIDSTLGRALGVLLFVVALLLSIPGVRAVRAEEPDMTPVGIEDLRGHGPGGSMAADPSAPAAQGPEACGDPSAGTTPGKRAQLAVQLPAAQAGEGSARQPEGFILLNNRGYNYGPPNEPDSTR